MQIQKGFVEGLGVHRHWTLVWIWEQGRVEVGAEARAAVEHCAQSVRCLPGKHEDWCSIPRTAEHMAGGIAQWLEHIMLLQAT